MLLASLPTPVSSKFLGRDELGQSRTTVGRTRSRGVTVLAGPPDPYGLIGMVQTVYCYYFTAHSDTWALATECYRPWPSASPLRMATQKISALSWCGGAFRTGLSARPLARPSSQSSPAAKSFTATGATRPVVWLVPRPQRSLREVRVSHQGLTVTLLPKLAFFALWDCSADPCCTVSMGSLSPLRRTPKLHKDQ